MTDAEIPRREPPQPVIHPLIEDIAIVAGELIASVALEDLMGEQKRLKVREQIKARFNLQEEGGARRLIDAMTPFSGLVEWGSDQILKGASDALDSSVDRGLDWISSEAQAP